MVRVVWRLTNTYRRQASCNSGRSYIVNSHRLEIAMLDTQPYINGNSVLVVPPTPTAFAAPNSPDEMKADVCLVPRLINV